MLFENVVKSFLVLGALSLSASLSGCGGSSGGDPGDATPTPGPTSTPTPTPTPVTGSTSYLFYSGSISAIDPAAPASPITVEAGTDIVAGSETTFLAGTYDAATKTFNDVHAHAIVYAKTDGKLYKASALKSSGTPTPTQISSENKVCGIEYYDVDLVNPDNSGILYSTPGANATCGNSDDVYKMVRLGMSATDAPVVAPVILPVIFKNRIASLIDGTTGAPSGWLVNDAGALKRCDASFATCGTSLKSVTSVSNDSYGWTNRVVLAIDHGWYVYDGDTMTLSTAIHTDLSGATSSYFHHASDGDKFYFVASDAPKSIYIVPVDGSAAATLLATDADDITYLRISANKLLYGTATAIKAVAKTGGTGAALVSGNSYPVAISGNHVYYMTTNGPIPTAGVIDDDGNNKSETANVAWIGLTYESIGIYDDNNRVPLQKIFRAEGYNALGAGKGYAGATLRSFNAASKAEVGVLGTVPTDIADISCYGPTANMLCSGSNSSQTDVFFLNAETPGSLVRVTNTPTKSESTGF
jgi:hypothetical protein